MIVIRRLDAMLEETKDSVLTLKKQLDEAGVVDQWPALCYAAGQAFCNASPFLLKDLTSRGKKQTLEADFKAYLDGFSPNVQEIIDKFNFRSEITNLVRNDVLGPIIEKFTSSDINLSPTPLYKDAEKKIVKLPGLDNHGMGTIFEEIIRRFNEENNEAAGQYWTPRDVVELMADLAFYPVEDKIKDASYSCYDPAMGSGSLLLNVRHYIQDVDSIEYYGQEIKTSTYNLARMNMIIHGIAATNQHLRNADTLDRDWPSDEVTTFDGVMMNPPYSQHWSADKGFLNDPRFSDYGVLAPKSKADYAFLLHGLYHLRDSGTMGIVLPHGVLFRGAAEGKIRQKLLEKGNIYAVIGLPAGIFYSTGIPTIIMVLKKDRPGRDVLFIDGSQEFEKGKAKNTLTPANIQKLFQAYVDRKDVDKFAHVASFEEIQENDFNLNIPRYVDTSEPEPEIDLGEVNRELADTNAQIQAAEKELADMMGDLTTTDLKKAKDLQDLLHLFQ